jgi:hypothetical protein
MTRENTLKQNYGQLEVWPIAHAQLLTSSAAPTPGRQFSGVHEFIMHRFPPTFATTPLRRCASAVMAKKKLKASELLTGLVGRTCIFGWAALAVAILACSPFLVEELKLQFRCHLNDSHLAQENLRLEAKMKKVRDEINSMREKVQFCQTEADNEYSRANRSYWGGFWHALVIVVSLLGIACCCMCLPAVFRYSLQQHGERLGLQ